MFRTILLLIILSITRSPKSNLQPNLCEELEQMMVNDQKYRKLPGYNGMAFFTILDSLKETNNISQKEYSNLSEKEQLKWGKKARAIADKLPTYSQRKIDSIRILQSEIDHYNTKRLIEIIEKHGWVDKQSLNCNQYFSTWVFFRHAPKEYFPIIRKIIEKAKISNKLGDSEYMLIDNHLKGRPMFDFNYVED